MPDRSSLARATMEAYVAAVNARDPECLAMLFAPDALFLGPLGTTYRGRAAIRDFYVGILPTLSATMVITSAVGDLHSCAIELAPQDAADDPELRAAAVDVVTVNEAGLITRLAVYLAPQKLS